MNFRTQIASIGIAWLGSVVSAHSTDAQSSANPCAYDESKPISFADWEGSDKARVRILGESCVNSILLVTIQDSHGVVRFAHAAIFYRLTPVNLDELTSDDARHVAELVWLVIGPEHTNKLESWKEPKPIYDMYDEVPALDEEEYDGVRALDIPYVCVQEYYEGADCYFFDHKWKVSRKLLEVAG
jgi:hypothetical protein